MNLEEPEDFLLCRICGLDRARGLVKFGNFWICNQCYVEIVIPIPQGAIMEREQDPIRTCRAVFRDRPGDGQDSPGWENLVRALEEDR